MARTDDKAAGTVGEVIRVIRGVAAGERIEKGTFRLSAFEHSDSLRAEIELAELALIRKRPPEPFLTQAVSWRAC